jgi:3'-phosphoadenosine 5'-phosphosulfate sulfotransferase (PAPS reductase)/FAD synthetase
LNAFTKADLKAFQSETLPQKEQRSLAKIAEWFSYWQNMVFIAFSGGKDSSVLADLCAYWCKAVGATLYLVFVNTGLEYPEIQKHVKNFAEYLRKKYNIEVVLEILYPQMRFDEVIKKYGYPMISKEVAKCVSSAKRLDSKCGQVCRERLNGTHKQKNGEISLFNCEKYKPLLDVDFDISHRCCDVMKKSPSHDYAKRTGRKQLTAQMASESRLREQQWIKHGCNGFDMSSPTSNPMSFWTEQDVLQYIKKYDIPIASVYGNIEYVNDTDQMRLEDFGIECSGCDELRTTGCQRTGCIFCGFGCHREGSPNRFERLKITHPRQYEYCIGGGEYNEDGKWQPNKKGLGLGHVFDELNKIYGDDFIKY